MSESQKMLASVSGAFAAHLLLLLLVVALPRANSANALAGADRNANGPREVTVDMGELMKRLERERAEEAEKKKAESPPEPEPPAPVRPFVATDKNRPESVAPENARFESDRNTSAASRLRPDESLPQHATPTLDGKSPLPHLTLANRDYVEGPLEAMPATPDPVKRTENAATPGGLAAPASEGGPAAPAAPALPPVTAATEVPPSDAIPATPPPAAPVAASGMRDDTPFSVKPGRSGVDEVGATREKSYLDPTARITAPALPDGDDQSAAGKGAGQEGKAAMETREPDPLLSETEEGPMPEDPDATPDPDAIPEKAATMTAPPPPASPAAPAAPAAPATPPGGIKPADEGLFAKGFNPEERQNVINGSLAKEGADAVDAVDTPVGRYKKAVRDAISATWHRYRQDHAEFVTWGILKLEFSVDSSGRVHGLEITKNEANAMLAEFSLRAIRDAKLPPMPEEVAKSLGSQGLVIQYDIIIY